MKHEVSSIIIHPDWDSEHPRFDADISLAALATDVTFNDRIQPICLPKPSQTEPSGNGIIIGWGRSKLDDFVNTKPDKLETQIVSNSVCFLRVPNLVYIASNRTFCSGLVNRSKSLCAGDSGSGFVAVDQNFEHYEVKGIVSSSLLTPFGCNTEVYSLFTDVTKFVDWIREKIAEVENEITRDGFCRFHERVFL